MKIELTKLPRFIVLGVVVLCISLVSFCDCLMNDQVMDYFDHCECENHSFIVNSLYGMIPDSRDTLPLEPPFLPSAVTASQVFHPPA
jgi:hypothetical protein